MKDDDENATLPQVASESQDSTVEGNRHAASSQSSADSKGSDKPQEDEQEEEEEEDWKIQRDAYKQSGDQAFRMKAYKTAISEYSSAIALDPDFVVLYSNRSAAYLANSEISKALKDAQQCVALDAGFVKGHSRLAAALLALRRYPQALESYQHVLKFEPENAAAKQGKERCEKELRLKQQQQQQQQEDDENQQAKNDEPAKGTSSADAKAEKSDGGGGVDDEDDLLDDFFKDVDEVVAKKKEEKAAAAATTATATNAIRNDRDVLGTTEQQMDRLLQEHYEWRNLNPYYVLQLPTTATDDDISRRYKALSLLLHPDKNHAKLMSESDRERAQLAYDQVQKAKQVLSDEDKKRHIIGLIEEGMKNGEHTWARQQKQQHRKGSSSQKESLESCQEKEVMRIFALVEQKRREVEERERKYEQRQQQQEDEQLEKERSERKFDKQWREEERVDKRVGNWRDFSHNKKRKV
jgi:DnaJ homolog subfamily C member 8